MDGQKPSMGRVVIYNHSGSADGKYPPTQSPAIIQKVVDEATQSCDLFVMSNTGGIFFAKSVEFNAAEEPGKGWEWPKRV